MSTWTTGAELLVELPGISPGTVVGTARITAHGPETQASAVVVSGVPVRVELPAEVGYSVRGRLTSGERLVGYAEVDGEGPWLPLPLTVLPGSQPQSAPGRRLFPGSSWAAGWTWDGQAGRFVPSVHLTPQQTASGTLLTGGLAKSTNVAQVSPSGGPASFVLLPGVTKLWVTGDRLGPEPGNAATLLDCLRRGDLAGAGAVVEAEAIGSDSSIWPSSRPVLLDLALGYYLLDADDDRLAPWAEHLADAYDWSADAQVISACALLRSPGDHREKIVERLETAVAYGLPVITRGLQLLNDNLGLILDAGSAARRAVLPYAICARTDTVLTTFWGELPGAPESAPVLGGRPAHAVPLNEDDGPVEWSGPIAGLVGELLVRRSAGLPPSAGPVLAELHASLEESLGLASRLSLAEAAPEVARLTLLLDDALRQGEVPVLAWAAGLAAAEDAGRFAGSASRLEHDRRAFRQVGAALSDACDRLRVHMDAVDRAESVEHALGPAIGHATRCAALLAADVRDAVAVLRGAGFGAEMPVPVLLTAPTAVPVVEA